MISTKYQLNILDADKDSKYMNKIAVYTDSYPLHSIPDGVSFLKIDFNHMLCAVHNKLPKMTITIYFVITIE